MILIHYLNIIGLSFAFIGSIILALTIFRTKNTINEISSTYWDFNPPLRKELFKERKQSLWGILLLISGFLMQLISYIFQI